MTIYARVSGTYQTVQTVWARVTGTWRQVKQAWTKVSGTWQLIYPTFAIFAGTVTDTALTGGAAAAGIIYQADGTIRGITNTAGSFGVGNWVTPTTLAPDSYTVRAHVVSGPTPPDSAC